MRLVGGGLWLIENATKENAIKRRGDARLTSKTLAGVLIMKLPPRMPFGPSLTLMVGIPSLSIAHVCQKPTPAMREIASSVVKASRILDRSAFAKSEGAIGVGLGQKLGVLTVSGCLYTGQGLYQWDGVGNGRDFPGANPAIDTRDAVLTGE